LRPPAAGRSSRNGRQRPVSVQVVGEDQLGAAGFGCVQDGACQRREQLGPIWGLAQWIDDRRADRREGRLGRSDTSAATPRVPSGCLTAAADRPHITASVDQLSRDGAADGACCADKYVQGIIRSIIVMLRLLAPIEPGAESPRSLLSVRSATDHMPERGLGPIKLGTPWGLLPALLKHW